MDFTMQVFDRVELHPLAQQSGGANSRAAEPKIAPKNIKDSVFKTWIEPWKELAQEVAETNLLHDVTKEIWVDPWKETIQEVQAARSEIAAARNMAKAQAAASKPAPKAALLARQEAEKVPGSYPHHQQHQQQYPQHPQQGHWTAPQDVPWPPMGAQQQPGQHHPHHMQAPAGAASPGRPAAAGAAGNPSQGSAQPKPKEDEEEWPLARLGKKAREPGQRFPTRVISSSGESSSGQSDADDDWAPISQTPEKPLAKQRRNAPPPRNTQPSAAQRLGEVAAKQLDDLFKSLERQAPKPGPSEAESWAEALIPIPMGSAPAPRQRQGVTAGDDPSTSGGGGEAAPDANRALQKLAALKALNPDAFPEGSVSFKPWNPEVHPVGSRGGGGIDFGDDPSGEPSPLGRIASRLLGHRWRAVLAALTIVVLAGLFFKSMHSAGWGVGRDEALLDWKPTNATAAAIPEASEALLLAEQPHLAFKDEGVAKGLSAQEEIAEREVQIADEIKQLQKDEEKVIVAEAAKVSGTLAGEVSAQFAAAGDARAAAEAAAHQVQRIPAAQKAPKAQKAPRAAAAGAAKVHTPAAAVGAAAETAAEARAGALARNAAGGADAAGAGAAAGAMDAGDATSSPQDTAAVQAELEEAPAAAAAAQAVPAAAAAVTAGAAAVAEPQNTSSQAVPAAAGATLAAPAAEVQAVAKAAKKKVTTLAPAAAGETKTAAAAAGAGSVVVKTAAATNQAGAAQ